MSKLRAVALLAMCTLAAASAGCDTREQAAASAGPTAASPSDPGRTDGPPGEGSATPRDAPATRPGVTPTEWSGRSGEPTRKPACPRPRGLAAAWASWPMPNPDGSGLPNPASYTNLGDGTVRDQVTCLVWQRTPPAKSYTYPEAKAYCAQLNLAGTGWHLPSRVELTSIIDPSRAGPAIDPEAFPETPVAFFWTSTPWAVTKSPARAWIVNFYEGLASNAAFQTGSYRVRCVRSPGGGGTPDYRTSGGQVTDPYTGLIWQQVGSTSTMDAQAATAYCAGLTLGGHKWRLPSIKELATTVDDGRVAPAIDRSAFPRTAKAEWYWSGSMAKPQADKRWALNYDDGYTNFRSITKGHARCVR